MNYQKITPISIVICFIAISSIVIAIKAVNEAAVFMDNSFRWGNGRDY